MATTPVNPNAIVRILYTAAGRQHKANFRVNIAVPPTIGTDPTIISWVTTANDRSGSDFVTYLWDKLKSEYQSTDHLDGYEVWLVTTDPPTFVYAASATIAGTHSGASTQRVEHADVITMRDTNSKKVKFYFFAGNDGALYRVTTVGSTHFSAFVSDMLPGAASGALREYIFGRGGDPIIQFMSDCGGANNALERKILFG